MPEFAEALNCLNEVGGSLEPILLLMEAILRNEK